MGKKGRKWLVKVQTVLKVACWLGSGVCKQEKVSSDFCQSVSAFPINVFLLYDYFHSFSEDAGIMNRWKQHCNFI